MRLRPDQQDRLTDEFVIVSHSPDEGGSVIRDHDIRLWRTKDFRGRVYLVVQGFGLYADDDIDCAISDIKRRVNTL